MVSLGHNELKLPWNINMCGRKNSPSLIWYWPLIASLSLAMGLLPDTKNYGLRIRQECRERLPRHRLQRKSLVSDPVMHHGTCITHVPWCMSGSLTRGGGENVPGIPGACATRDFMYLVRGPCDTPINRVRCIWSDIIICVSLVTLLNSSPPKNQNGDTVTDYDLKCNFIKENWLFSIFLFFEVYSISIDEKSSSNLDNGLTPSRRKTIIWTNDDHVRRHLYAIPMGWWVNLVLYNFRTVYLICSIKNDRCLENVPFLPVHRYWWPPDKIMKALTHKSLVTF